MRYKYISAKIDRQKYPELVRWLDETDININQTVIHLLSVAMNLGATNFAPLPVKENEAEIVAPKSPIDEADPIAGIAAFLDGVI